jgi:hypothetical protein
MARRHPLTMTQHRPLGRDSSLMSLWMRSPSVARLASEGSLDEPTSRHESYDLYTVL